MTLEGCLTQVGEEFRSALRVLMPWKNDAALLEAKCSVLQLKQALDVLDMERAVPHFVIAVDRAALVDAQGPWISPRDAAAARRRLDKLRLQLRECWAALTRTISFASDYDVLLKLFEQHDAEHAAQLAQDLACLAVDDWRTPKYLWLALLLADQSAVLADAVRAWFARSHALELETVTHCAVTDAVAARALLYAGDVESVTFRHSIITDARYSFTKGGVFLSSCAAKCERGFSSLRFDALSSLAGLPRSVQSVMLHGCNFVTTEGLIALFKVLASVEYS